jgi:hypothetical protein
MAFQVKKERRKEKGGKIENDFFISGKLVLAECRILVQLV